MKRGSADELSLGELCIVFSEDVKPLRKYLWNMIGRTVVRTASS